MNSIVVLVTVSEGTCGVPVRSILGPSLFNLYMLPLGLIIQNIMSAYHCYAVDTTYALLPTDYHPIGQGLDGPGFPKTK